MATKTQVKNYMREIVEDHIGDGWEVDCTGVAEDAMCEFPDHPEDSDFFEWAFEVAEEWEAEHGVQS